MNEKRTDRIAAIRSVRILKHSVANTRYSWKPNKQQSDVTHKPSSVLTKSVLSSGDNMKTKGLRTNKALN